MLGAAGVARSCSWSQEWKPGKLARSMSMLPQNYVPSVAGPGHQGQDQALPEHPGKTYSGTVEASSQAGRPESRRHEP